MTIYKVMIEHDTRKVVINKFEDVYLNGYNYMCKTSDDKPIFVCQNLLINKFTIYGTFSIGFFDDIKKIRPCVRDANIEHSEKMLAKINELTREQREFFEMYMRSFSNLDLMLLEFDEDDEVDDGDI